MTRSDPVLSRAVTYLATTRTDERRPIYCPRCGSLVCYSDDLGQEGLMVLHRLEGGCR